MDYGAIVIGAGHNGLICAAYLARAGIPTLLLEAREEVGGCASTVDALGARVNICNCDHVVFRTTPVLDELGLAEHGLRYLDVEPAQVQATWNGEAGVAGLPRRRAHDRRARAHPSRRGRRLSPVCRSCDPCRGARPRDGVHTAHTGKRAEAARRPPSAGRGDAAPMESSDGRRRAAVVLLARGDHGPRRDDGSRRRGSLTVRASHRVGRARLTR